MNMKNKWLRIVLLGMVCICSLGMFGCRKNAKISNKDEAGQAIQKKLEEKYDKTFQVLDVESVSVSGGVPLGKEARYLADVCTEDETQTFRAEIKKDGTDFKDNYYQYFFEKDLEENVYAWVEQVEGARVTDYKAQFMEDAGDWVEGESLDDMLTGTETYICTTVEVEAESISEAAEKCYEVYQGLEEHHTEPSITFSYRGENINVAAPYKNNDKTKIIEGIQNRFQNSLQE